MACEGSPSRLPSQPLWPLTIIRWVCPYLHDSRFRYGSVILHLVVAAWRTFVCYAQNLWDINDAFVWHGQHSLRSSPVRLLDETIQTRTTRTPAFWDTTRRPVITHTSASHQSQNKTSKLHILKNCQKFKFENIARNLTGDTRSEVAW